MPRNRTTALSTTNTIAALVFSCLLQLIPVGRAEAYVDPGTSGLVSQVLYVLFYGALATCLYFFRSLKSYVAGLKEFLAKFFGRWL
jgi:hypothetical protein